MERVVVIGGGGAGTAAATITKRLNPDLKVTVFTEFTDIAYSPCGIPFVHGGEIPKFEDLFLSTVERYREDAATCGLSRRQRLICTAARSRRRPARGLRPDIMHRLYWSSGVRARTSRRAPSRAIPQSRSSTRSRLEKRVAVVGAGPICGEMRADLARRGLHVDITTRVLLMHDCSTRVAKPGTTRSRRG